MAVSSPLVVIYSRSATPGQLLEDEEDEDEGNQSILANMTYGVAFDGWCSNIHYAADNGDLDMIIQILNSTCFVEDINKLDKRGRTPLHIAVKKDNAEIVEVLLAHGSDPNIRKETGNNYTPIHMAKSGKITELLIAHGADISVRSSNGNTPVHTSVRGSAVDVLKVLVKTGARVDVKNDFGMSPLHLFSNHVGNESDADIEIVKLLSVAGIDLNTTTFEGKTALHYLAQSCDAHGLISLLVYHGARIDVVDMKGYYPIHYFLKNLNISNIRDPKDVLKLFIPSKDAANFTTFKGKSSLHYLSKMMESNLIRFMIAEGGDVSIEDNAGRSPLHYMSDVPSKAEDVVLVLVTNEANINAQDAWGRTPLIVAVDKKSKALTESLIRNGANVNVPDKLGNTALHTACYRDAPDITEMLLAAGGNIHALDINGTSPLHAAAYAGSLCCVKRLIENDVDHNAVDAELRTPLDIALVQRHFDIVYALSSDESKSKSQTVELTNVSNRYMDIQSVLCAIETYGITRNGRTVDELLSELLQSPTVGRGADETEAQEIQRVMENVIQTLAHQLIEHDTNLKCTILHAGSTSEGTKTRCPDEFDFMVCLEILSDLVEAEWLETSRIHLQLGGVDTLIDVLSYDDPSDSEVPSVTVSTSDYVRLKMKDEDSCRFESFRLLLTSPTSFADSRIACSAMYEWFSNVVAKIIFHKNFPKDHRLVPVRVTLAPSVEFHWNGSRFKDMPISVDLVPAVRLPKWLDTSRRDCKLLIGDMLSRSCLAVPKDTSGDDDDVWRSSLALIETNIFRLLRPCVRNSYIVCKCLISSAVLPAIHFEKDTKFIEIFKAGRPDMIEEEFYLFAEDMVPSYVLKMTFLSVLEERISQFGLAHVYNIDPSEVDKDIESSDDHVDAGTDVSVDVGNGYTDKNIDSETADGTTDDVRYGPALTMYIPQRSTDFDITLVRDVFRECERRLENKFVPSVFNHEQNVLGNRLLSGDVDKALIFIRVVNKLLT